MMGGGKDARNVPRVFVIVRTPQVPNLQIRRFRELFGRLRHYRLCKRLQGLQSWRKVASITISDEALMLEFRGGSRAAFEELFARYQGPLFGYFRRRLNGDKR